MENARYPLMEHFLTIQGEGANTGKAAYFLRLAGCDVGCVWCDVKDSWDKSVHPTVSLDSMIGHVQDAGARRVVVTGGEPCMYDLKPLTDALKAIGLERYLETSGAYPITGDWEWICVSPKKFKEPLKESLLKADELKIVAYNRHDFDWAESHRAFLRQGCRLFIQPEHSVFDKMTPLVIDYVKLHPEWTMSLQTHKFLDIP
ncbi:MAG: 7-carboxy-7-deazaguanine synthase QueE [Bacteroidota bacterium]